MNHRTTPSTTRRKFLSHTAVGVVGITAPVTNSLVNAGPTPPTSLQAGSHELTLCLGGDVMTGRAIDQILPHPGDAQLYERYASSALEYLAAAQKASGRIPRAVDFSYIWGDALAPMRKLADVRVMNLETAVTTSNAYWHGKGINYRMHPNNAACLTAAHIDCCTLANNHTLDWGYPGLTETVTTLQASGIQVAGAGENLEKAAEPAVIDVTGKGRVLVFSFGSVCSGIPPRWGATANRAGIQLLMDLSEKRVQQVGKQIRGIRQASDVVVASIHWGDNWGYEIPREQTKFAHQLIDDAGVDIVHGHSSHHPRTVEVYQGRPILYGCGDLMNDYEGFQGYERYRDDLALAYFVAIDPIQASLRHIRILPFQIKRFRLTRASAKDARWLRDVLNRKGRASGTRVHLTKDHSLQISWK